MDTVQEPDLKQASRAKDTAEDIKEKDPAELLEWIQQKRPNPLKHDDHVKAFKKARISGRVFSRHAGDVGFFKNECGLPIGVSEDLAYLAMEIEGVDAAGIKKKRQQSEDVELSYSQSFVSPGLEADLVPGPHISQRPKTVTKLAELLDDQWVVRVRGTPVTGKTTLAFLLRRYYQKRGNRVVFFSHPSRPSNISLASYLTEKCEKEGYFGIQLNFFSEANIIFIIDEAQTAYPDGDLWEFIKSKRDQRIGPKFCIFTKYGSPSQGLRTVKQVSILPSHREHSPDICLFYRGAEFEDVLTRYCAHPGHKLPLEKAARTYLYSITSGHPGAVHSMLFYLYEVFGAMVKYGLIQQITEDDLVETLIDDAAVFSSLTQPEYPVHRSFPVQAKLTAPAMKVLSTIRRDGSVPFKYDDDGMKLCFQEGWIHVDVEDENPPSLICFLPSRLHEKYIECFITSVDPRPFPHHRFPNLRELCIAVFKDFSRKSLLLSSAERGPTIAATRTLESQYQDEFYRAFTSLLGNGVGISSEWSRSKESSRSKGGQLDFRILGPKWGVELLRDGTKKTLDEHYKRFLPDGKYHKWISKGLISDWLVIDCRCSTPERYTPPGPNLWHAVFAEDYSTLRILDADNQEIMSEVCLMG